MALVLSFLLYPHTCAASDQADLGAGEAQQVGQTPLRAGFEIFDRGC